MAAHDVGIYVLAWGTAKVSEEIQVTDTISGTLLDTETLSNLSNEGIYLQWVVTGSVAITFTDLNGSAAMVSAMFFDPPSAAASVVSQDATTQGNWIGSYGSEGYNVIGNTSSYPAYAIVQPQGESTNTWTTSTSDPRALQTADGSSRQASDWYSATSFSIGLDLTDGQPHDIALYALDWDAQGAASRSRFPMPAQAPCSTQRPCRTSLREFTFSGECSATLWLRSQIWPDQTPS